MLNTSRRNFLGSASAAAGAVSFGKISGCVKPAQEKPVEKKLHHSRMKTRRVIYGAVELILSGKPMLLSARYLLTEELWV